MEQLKQLQKELKNMSLYNPMYGVKVTTLLDCIESAVNSGKINADYAKEVRDSFSVPEYTTLGAFRVYKNALLNNFTLKDFELTSLLKLRQNLYEILAEIKTCTNACDSELLKLLNKLEYAMNNKEESFWDSFFLLLVLLRTPYHSNVFNDNKVNILKYIKYAAEEEGKMLDTLAEGRMELFANISPSVGKNNAILFYLTRTKFVDESNLFDVVRGVISNDSSFIKQTPKLTMLLENYAKAKNQLDVCSSLELLLQEKILLDNIWIFEVYFTELKKTILEYNNILNDYRMYSFLLKHIIEHALIDNKSIECRTDIDVIYSILDKYNVEYFGKAELYKVLQKGKE